MLARTPAGRDLLVIGQKSGVVWALDPDAKGKLVWQRRVGKGSALGGIEMGSSDFKSTTLGEATEKAVTAVVAKLAKAAEKYPADQVRGRVELQRGQTFAREIEVLELLKRGLSNAAIASELVISVSTAKVHVHHVLAKLGVKTRLQAVLKAGELESGAARQRLSQRLE